jgi:hypothetical protein
MKERLVLTWCAVCVLVVSSTAFAQRLPQDDPNPAWKGELSSKPTPRGEDGRPELVGMWQRSGAGFTAEHGPFFTSTRGRNGEGKGVQGWKGRGDGAVSFINFERDSGIALRAATNKPQYKPEHWERVQWMDKHGNQEDPEFVCYPSGVPRIGPPDRIIQSTPNEFILLYQNRNGIVVRAIPMNAQPLPYEQWEGISWLGKPTGHWDGDTLVVESVDFGDHSWLEFPGYIHSNEMRVTERFTRTGDVLKWEATVNDPEMFLEPWVWNPWYTRVHSDKDANIREANPCRDYNSQHLNTERG